MRRILAVVLMLAGARLFAADPDPRQILRDSLETIARAKTIRVRAQTLSDDTLDTGQKLQRSADNVLQIRRPDSFRADVVSDRYRRTIVYDGTTLAVNDPDQKLYATFNAPGTIDQTVALVRDKLGLELPLGHLFANDAATRLPSGVVTATYVGLHRAAGVASHHLAFTQADVDWQIWISAEPPALPRKIVIDHKKRAGRPQFIALLSDWSLSTHFAANEFRFVPAAGSRKIEFLQPAAQE